MTRPTNIPILDSLEDLHGHNGAPSPRTQAKIINRLEQHSRDFLARSPFFVLATGNPEGSDASPRGDEAGFVKVLDDTTLLIPERPGNRLADSLSNILLNPKVGLLFMIPGMDETLRINGDAFITHHQPYLEMLACRGKTPKLAIVVDVQQIYFHCPKAFVRSNLWDQSAHMDRSELPTLGKMLLDQITQSDTSAEDVAAIDAALETDTRENLY